MLGVTAVWNVAFYKNVCHDNYGFERRLIATVSKNYHRFIWQLRIIFIQILLGAYILWIVADAHSSPVDPFSAAWALFHLHLLSVDPRRSLSLALCLSSRWHVRRPQAPPPELTAGVSAPTPTTNRAIVSPRHFPSQPRPSFCRNSAIPATGRG
jgi:hypothetical protein